MVVADVLVEIIVVVVEMKEAEMQEKVEQPQYSDPEVQVHSTRALVAITITPSNRTLIAIDITPSNVTWFVDLGASDHLCLVFSIFSNIVTLFEPIKIFIGDNQYIHATTRGTVFLSTLSLRLNSVLYIPILGSNLISVGKLTKEGFSIGFDNV